MQKMERDLQVLGLKAGDSFLEGAINGEFTVG